jgi:tetratricopeptide (TPR) repeat protein
VKRQVALKVIKPGMDTKAVIARFEAERQALALLDHPNIAKVFDAGTTSEGRPYFVMELVRGIRITEYCDQGRLTIPERLSLFIQVCQAIQHAHQKGIIHRDIKPSNVLVTMHDGLPLAKVIDFGIAKATRGRLIDRTLNTEIDQVMGTPAYVSPEQTQPTQATVDTRSDIYSLGVLLYELLTSNTPFDARDLAGLSIEQLRKRICTEEPLRPSRRLRASDGELLARVAIGSASAATKLVRQIQDDLDWVVMQCLEKDPSRRYQAVNELVADLDRYLRHKPVLARPPSLMYTARKLARRNRIALASGLVVLTFLIFISAFAVTMTIQARRIAAERDFAEHERQQAQRVSNVALKVFAIADPFQSFGTGIDGSTLLAQAASSIERELRDQPVARARLLRSVGGAYIRRGQFKPAILYLSSAVAIFSQMDLVDKDSLSAMIDLSFALTVSGDLQNAREMLARTQRLARSRGLERSAEYAKVLLSRGRIEMVEGRIPEARAEFLESLQLYREVVGPQSVEVAEVLGELSVASTWMDDHANAERIARQAIAIFESTVPSMHPDRVRTEMNLAEALYLQNRANEAATILVEALRKDIQLFGHNSPQVANVLDTLAIVKYSQRKLDEAERYSRDAVATSRIVLGERHSFTANYAITLGRTLIELRRYQEAETTLRQALEIFAATVPPDHQYIASAEYFLGELLLTTKRPREAEAVLTASMKRWERGGAPHWRVMRSASALGEALLLQGRTQEGENYLAESARPRGSTRRGRTRSPPRTRSPRCRSSRRGTAAARRRRGSAGTGCRTRPGTSVPSRAARSSCRAPSVARRAARARR